MNLNGGFVTEQEKRVQQLHVARCVVYDLANDYGINCEKDKALAMHAVAGEIAREIQAIDPGCFAENHNKLRIIHQFHWSRAKKHEHETPLLEEGIL